MAFPGLLFFGVFSDAIVAGEGKAEEISKEGKKGFEYVIAVLESKMLLIHCQRENWGEEREKEGVIWKISELSE